MSTDNGDRDKRFHLWGWGLFLACAGFFIASGIMTGDLLSVIGSVIFLVGCVIFIVPLVSRGKRDKGE